MSASNNYRKNGMLDIARGAMQSADEEGARAWRIATEGHRLHVDAVKVCASHLDALKLLWGRVVLVQKQLGDTKGGSSNHVQKTLKPCVTVVAGQPQRVFAQFIKVLVINLQTGYKNGLLTKDIEPFLKSLDRLKPKLSALTKVQYYGALPPKIFVSILEMESIQVLKLRMTNTQDTQGILCIHGFLNADCLRLSRLQELQSTLRSLDVYEVVHMEAEYLAVAVKQLRQLASLRVVTAAWERETRARSAEKLDKHNRDRALVAFLRAVYQKQTAGDRWVTFPPALKRLILIEEDPTYVLLARRSHADLRRIRLPSGALPSLEYLYLDAANTKALPNMLHKLQPNTLTHITCQLTGALDLDGDFLKKLVSNLPSLRRITVPSAWRNAAIAQTRMPANFHARQVFLAEPPNRQHAMIIPHGARRAPNTLLRRLYGEPNIGGWARDAEHIMCDHVDLGTLAIDDVDKKETLLQSLKVLALRPEAQKHRHRGERAWTLDFPPYHQGVCGIPLSRPNDDRELARMRAEKIAERCQLPNLCLLSIYNNNFWIEQGVSIRGNRQIRTRTVWWLSVALQDPTQRAEYERIVFKRDRDFLTYGGLIIPTDVGKGARILEIEEACRIEYYRVGTW